MAAVKEESPDMYQSIHFKNITTHLALAILIILGRTLVSRRLVTQRSIIPALLGIPHFSQEYGRWGRGRLHNGNL